MKKKAIKSAPMTAGELRKLIKEKKLGWEVDPKLADSDPLPQYPTGAELVDDKKAVASDAKKLKQETQQPPFNPFLRERWIELGILKEEPGSTDETSSSIKPKK